MLAGIVMIDHPESGIEWKKEAPENPAYMLNSSWMNEM